MAPDKQKRQPDREAQSPSDTESGSDTEFFSDLTLEGWRRWALLLVLLTGLTIAGYVWLGIAGDETRVRIDYTTFLEQVEAGNVARVTISGNRVRGTLEKPAQTTNTKQRIQYTEFATYVPSIGDETLVATLRAERVAVEAKPMSDSSWANSIVSLLLLAGLGVLLVHLMRTKGTNILSIGRSQAKQYDRSQARTTFDDVAGTRGAKQELRELIDFLRTPQRFTRLGGTVPKGVLLVGPPGTGKTLLARAVAGEAGVPFFSVSGSQFTEMFVGVGASRVRDLFEEAKKVAPAVIFIDELDSIGRRRGAGVGGGHDEREQTLNQLLTELDGFEPNENVIVMAATNRHDILDPALLRPGRFDRRVTVELPTTTARLAILRLHARDKPLTGDVDLETIARGTRGFSGADLENLLNEAALLAGRKNKDLIDADDVEAARDKVLMGLQREGLVLTDAERRLLAYHEAGHAVVAAVLPHADPIHKVTIVPRGRAMGVTQQLPERDTYIYPRSYLLDRIAVMMGGRAAEELMMGAATSGAANDFQEATKLARKMVLEWGMSERFQHISFDGRDGQVFLGQDIAQRREFSESTAHEVDREIESILDAAYERAMDTLRHHGDGLERVTEALLAEEEVSGNRVLREIEVQENEA